MSEWVVKSPSTLASTLDRYITADVSNTYPTLTEAWWSARFKTLVGISSVISRKALK